MDSEFKNNFAESEGEVVFVKGKWKVEIINTVFLFNNSEYGVTIMAQKQTSINIDNCTFHRDAGHSTNFITISNSVTLIISNSEFVTFEDMIEARSHCSVHIRDTTFTILGLPDRRHLIVENKTSAVVEGSLFNRGAVLGAFLGAQCALRNSTFNENSAIAFVSNRCTFSIENSIIENNTHVDIGKRALITV